MGHAAYSLTSSYIFQVCCMLLYEYAYPIRVHVYISSISSLFLPTFKCLYARSGPKSIFQMDFHWNANKLEIINFGEQLPCCRKCAREKDIRISKIKWKTENGITIMSTWIAACKKISRVQHPDLPTTTAKAKLPIENAHRTNPETAMAALLYYRKG